MTLEVDQPLLALASAAKNVLIPGVSGHIWSVGEVLRTAKKSSLAFELSDAVHVSRITWEKEAR